MSTKSVVIWLPQNPPIGVFTFCEAMTNIHPANASDSMRIARENDSNVIDKSDWHQDKHDEPRISTLLGIMIDWSDDLSNDSDSIRVKCEFDSNVIDESDSQDEKHVDPRISTLLGIKIDWRDDHENAFDSESNIGWMNEIWIK
jgi:hypothetical protein